MSKWFTNLINKSRPKVQYKSHQTFSRWPFYFSLFIVDETNVVKKQRMLRKPAWCRSKG